MIAALLAGAGALSAALLLLMNQPIERIRVDGQFQHLSALDVEKAVRAQLHGAGLVSVRLDDVRRALRLLPWVKAATVQRSWPRGLAVDGHRAAGGGALEQLRIWSTSAATCSPSNARFVPPELPQLDRARGERSGRDGALPGVQGRLSSPACA